MSLFSGTLVRTTEAKLPLPRCERNEDCFVICRHCGICFCGSGICVHGCPAPPPPRKIRF